MGKALKHNSSKINAHLAANYLFAIEERMEHNKIINKFQDLLIIRINNFEAEDSTSKNHNRNTRYEYSKDGPEHLTLVDWIH